MTQMLKFIAGSRRKIGLVTVLLGLPLSNGAARADTIFSNLGVGESYSDTVVSFAVCGGGTSSCPQPTGLDEAMPFTVGAISYDLTEIEIGLTNNSGTNGATVELLNSVTSPATLTVPGSNVLGSWTLTDLPPNFHTDTIQPSQTITVGTTIQLAAGTTYWLAVFPADSSTVDTWDANNTGEEVFSADNINTTFGWIHQVPTNPNGAYAILGTPIAAAPEPSGFVLLLSFGSAIIVVNRLCKGRSTGG